MSKGTTVTTDSSEKQEAQLEAESIAQWNLPLKDVYRHSLSFLKDKEGSKALRLSYADKVQLLALEKQVTHEPYRADLTSDIGFLDVVGNDRKNAWNELGTMSRSAAMLEHVKLVHKCCPLLKAYIEAQKANRDHEGGAAAADSAQQPQALLLDHSPEHEVVQKYDNLPNVSDTDSKVKLDTLSNDLQKLKLEEEQLRVQQEAQIRTLLNQQTAIQFRQYAQEQHPNDTKKQDELVRQLQQQHFQQYMTQVLKQQIEHQKQQARQIAALLRQQRKQQVEQAAAPEQQLDAASAGGLLIVDESNEDVAGSSRTAPPNGAHALSPLGASANVANVSSEQFTGADDVESNVDDETDADAELSEADDSEAGTRKSRSTTWSTNNRHVVGSVTNTNRAQHKSHSEKIRVNFNTVDNAKLCKSNNSKVRKVTKPDVGQVSMANLWTRSDLNEFKRQVKSDSSAYFEVGNGESRTVR